MDVKFDLNISKASEVKPDYKVILHTTNKVNPVKYTTISEISPTLKTINGDSILGSGDLTIVGLPGFIEYNETNKTFWNNGPGNITTNTSFGEFALGSNSLGEENVAIGVSVLENNVLGSYNTAIGSSALKNNTESINSALGYYSLSNNTTGMYNTGIGVNTIINNTTGSRNTALGHAALYSNTVGNNNTALGCGASYNTVGSNNTSVGYNAGSNSYIGSNNIFLGSESTATGNFSGSIAIGVDATITANNQFVVGSVATNAGSVTTESNTSSQVWNVVINGVARKILLA